MARSINKNMMTDSPRIVHAPLPWYSPQLSVGSIVIAVGVTFGVFVAWQGISGGAIMWGVILGAVSGASIVGLGFLYNSSLRKRMNKRIGSECEATHHGIEFAPELRHLTADLLESHRRAKQNTSVIDAWIKFNNACERLGIRRPDTIVDSTLAARLTAIERPSHTVEPESILGSGDSARSAIWLLPTGYGLAGTYLLYRQEWFGGLMLIGLAGLIAVTASPTLRDRFRIMRWDDGNVIAGMGTLKDQNDRRWTIENAVMVIQTKETAGALFVRVVGEEGPLELTFVDEHDPDFVKLWQRWTHPRPRPELKIE